MEQKLEHFPLSNFPDFPGRNAFVEVSGRGGGGEGSIPYPSNPSLLPVGEER
jgi:hypothetical protein